MISEVTVHTFRMGDVEDPDLYAAQPMCEWERSEAGQWVMSHAVETPSWYRGSDPYNWGYQYRIVARLTDADHVFFKLKFQ
jgi:hypothetical protein